MGGSVKHFNEFAKEIYETCDCNFFNLAIILVVVVFSIVRFITFLGFASNNYRTTVKNFRIPSGVKFFLLQCDVMRHPVSNVQLCGKTTLYHKN